jgi:hypothetical protein
MCVLDFTVLVHKELSGLFARWVEIERSWENPTHSRSVSRILNRFQIMVKQSIKCRERRLRRFDKFIPRISYQPASVRAAIRCSVGGDVDKACLITFYVLPYA